MRRTLCTLMLLGSAFLVRAQTNVFNILYKHDFNNDTPGLYDQDEWRSDWNSPAYYNGMDKTQIVDCPDGNRVMKWNYPKGSVGPSAGGGQWEAPFTGQDEVYMSYNIKFRPGFNWVEGGKLPGPGGGPAYGSGTPMEWDEGFSARLMWRYGDNAGKVMFYAYYQDKPGLYGAGHPFADYVLNTNPERWYNITIRCVLNSIDPARLVTDPQHAGNHDGILEGYIDGVLMTSITGLSFRNLPSIKIDKMHITSFFGGSGANYAAVNDEWAYLDDVYLFTYASGMNVPRGHTPSPAGRVLELPNMKGAIAGAAPAVPSSLTVTGKSTATASLKWADNSRDESGYRLERSTDGVVYTLVSNLASNSTTFQDAGLKAGTKYFYRVRSYNSYGSSLWSNITSVTTDFSLGTTPGSTVACWTFDNNCTDKSGNNNNLSLYNGATYSTDFKQGGYSLSLDGSNDYAASNTMNLGDEFSLAMWVKITSGRSNIQTLAANGASGASSNGFKFLVNTYATTDCKLSFESGDGSAPAVTRSDAGVFKFDQWNYVVATANRLTGSVRLYYNGTDVTSSAGIHKNFKNNDILRLGRMTNNIYGMKGTIDHVDVYTKVLTLAEVQSSMAAFDPSAVNAPGNLAASSSAGKVILNWKDNSADETGFQLERSAAAGSGFTVIKSLAAGVTTFTDTQVLAGSTYYYRVKAMKVNAGSAYSNTASVVVVLPAPAIPSSLSAGNVTTSSVTLNWKNNDTYAAGFRIDRSASPTSGFLQIASPAAGITSYTDSNLSEGTTYYYRMMAYNSTGNSAWSSTVSATTSAVVMDQSSLLAYWPLDNNGSDFTGHGYNLSLYYGSGFTSSHREGSGSLLLNGSNECATSPSIDPGNEFTITAWVNIPSGRPNIQTLIANGSSGSAANGFKILVNTYATTDRKISFESGDGSSSSITRSDAGVFEFDRWNFIAVTVNKSSGAARLYYNGKDVTATSASHTRFNTSAPMMLGIMSNGLFGMYGQLDEVRIYKKVLTPTGVQSAMYGTVISGPTELSARNITWNSLELTWKDNAENELSYDVERSQDPLSGFVRIARLGAGAVSCQDTGLNADAGYYYRVRAVNASGSSAWSNIISVRTNSRPLSVSDMYAYWPLDGKGTDLTGHGYDLTLYNGPAWSSDKKQGSASILFDGTNDFASSPVLNPGNDFTLSMWVKIPSGQYGIQTLMANGASGAASAGFKLYVNTYGTADRKIAFESGDGSTSAITRTNVAVFGLGTWNFIAVTVNRSSGSVRLYYNGNDVTASSGSHAKFKTDGVIRLGSMINNICQMKGHLDDVRIYDRILTSPEIGSIMDYSSSGSKAAKSFETDAGSASPGAKEAVKPEFEFTVFPNPFANSINISNASEIQRVEIIDLTGKILRSVKGDDESVCTIDTENLVPGIYLVRITGKDNLVTVLKAIRN